MDTSADTRILLAQEFSCFEELANSTIGWSTDFRQLSAEAHSPAVFQAALGPILFSSARFGCIVDQRGQTPEHMRTFALLGEGSPEIYWYKQRVGPEHLLVFPRHREISCISPRGFNVNTLSFPEALITRYFEQQQDALNHHLSDSDVAVKAPPGLLARLRNMMLQRARSIAREHSPSFAAHAVSDTLQEQALDLLYRILTATGAPREYPVRNRQGKLNTALEYIEANSKSPIRNSDLTALTHMSERALQYLFNRELGMSPKAFVLGKRLSGARFDLWHAHPATLHVRTIAADWGFWHMSQFAAIYRKVYGELPSTTLNRPA